MMARVLAAILAAWAGMLAAAPAGAATVDGGLLTNAVFATVVPYVGVPSGTVTYSATATVMVCTPTISLYKRASMTVQGAGGAVVFCIEIRNLSGCASAFNVLVSDPVQPDLAYAYPSEQWVVGSTTIDRSFYLVTPGIWAPGTPNPGTMTPYILFWKIDKLAMGGSGLLCYSTTVK